MKQSGKDIDGGRRGRKTEISKIIKKLFSFKLFLLVCSPC
jgi:hypothetical protein